MWYDWDQHIAAQGQSPAHLCAGLQARAGKRRCCFEGASTADSETLTDHCSWGGAWISTVCSAERPTTAGHPDSSMRVPVCSSRTIQGWVW